ncbi:MAG TPA: hypothetical protein VKB25_12550 [Conexibacter sp.]|nr:hypothetical protein [Conexibacter sp.]
MSRFLRRSTCIAALLLAGVAASASAAETISISFGADPTEEVPLPIMVRWTSVGPSPEVHVTVKPAGGLGCAPNYAADDANSSDVISTGGTAVGEDSTNRVFGDPGIFTMCGYLQEGSTVMAATGPVALTVRSATASIGISAPARVDPGKVFQISFTVTAELARSVYVTAKPAGGRGCEPNYAADDPLSNDVISTGVQGTRAFLENYTASTTRGTYLLCAYVQEGSSDAPEATASTEYLVAPDPCTVAQRSVQRAKRIVRKAQAAVTRNHHTWQHNVSAALRSRGTTRKYYSALAQQAARRERQAKRRRSAARATLASRQSTAAQACGTPPQS